MSITLRPYQNDGIKNIRTVFSSGKRRVLYVLPTGGGKTVVFSDVAAKTAQRAKNVLILTHRIELLRQTSEKLSMNGVEHGLINPKFTPNLSAPVQVASVQTLTKRLDKYKFKFDLIIIDEAHHATASTWRKIIDHYTDAYVLGVTATPTRTDGSGLGSMVGGIFDEIVIGPQIYELIEMSFLVKPTVYAPVHKLDLSGVDIVAGDYDKKQLLKKVDKPQITGNAVSHYKKICPGTPCVVFCISRQHAEHVAAEFQAAGFRFYAVDGLTDDETRKRTLNGLSDGSVQGVCSCDLISEGTDIPAIGALIMLRPTHSEGLYIQQGGRGLRPCIGKETVIILDHVGNTLKHGMLEYHREWNLNGKKKRKSQIERDGKEIKVKQCNVCYIVHQPAPSCPACGYVYEIKPQIIDEVDGELKKIEKKHEEMIKVKMRQEVGMAKTLDELESIARARNYKPGWAKRMYDIKLAKGKVQEVLDKIK
jgi:DNA repair protein RadD